MTGRIVYLNWITRRMVQAKPEARFVFGDNAERIGMGGQAGSMRGEPNAIGIATKWAPGMRETDFFSDHDERCEDLMRLDVKKVRDAILQGCTVNVPYDGLGTGLSQLPTRAPKLYAMLYAEFNALPGEPCPWPKPDAK